MRFNELKWEHLAIVLQRLKWGDRAVEAAKVAGISASIWNKARRAWDEVPGHLARVDPEGTPVDLEYLDELVFESLKRGGRPEGAVDTVRRSNRQYEAAMPTLVVTNPSIHVEDGMFYDE